MRTLFLAILLAGAAASPALAQDQNDNGHHKQKQQQQQPAPQQNPRGQGGGNHWNGGNAYRPQAQQFVRQPPAQVQEGQRGNWAGQRVEGRPYVAPQGQAAQRAYGYRGYRGGYNGQVQQVEQGRGGQWNGQRNWNGQNGWNGQRVVQQQHVQGDRWANGGWNRDWRNDRRYDWQRYRDSHRSIFRLGVYFDPFGYGYQQFDIGYRLSPVYFGQQYWIDPAMYELPYPPPGTQWVRYWDDAVLVDMYSGEVVDVIHNFFW